MEVPRDLATQGLVQHGEMRTRPVPRERSVDEFIEMMHSTGSLARARLSARSESFDREVREVFARHHVDRVLFEVVGPSTGANRARANPRKSQRRPRNACRMALEQRVRSQGAGSTVSAAAASVAAGASGRVADAVPK